MTIEVGDWIAFQRNATVVIDKVEYVNRTLTGSTYTLVTAQHGDVDSVYVLESRKPLRPAQPSVPNGIFQFSNDAWGSGGGTGAV